MESNVQRLFAAGLAQSTQKSYRSGERKYLQFCAAAGHSPYPVSEVGLSGFVASLFEQGLSASATKMYLAAVRHAQISLGLGDPVFSNMPQLQYVVKGAKRLSAGRPQRVRLPITPEILRQLRAVWERMPSRHDAAMLWAAATLCFFAFLRMGEAVVPSESTYDHRFHLSYGDIRVDNRSHPSLMEVDIKRSKCNQFANGITLVVGVSGADICPVSAMMGYLVCRG